MTSSWNLPCLVCRQLHLQPPARAHAHLPDHQVAVEPFLPRQDEQARTARSDEPFREASVPSCRQRHHPTPHVPCQNGSVDIRSVRHTCLLSIPAPGVVGTTYDGTDTRAEVGLRIEPELRLLSARLSAARLTATRSRSRRN